MLASYAGVRASKTLCAVLRSFDCFVGSGESVWFSSK